MRPHPKTARVVYLARHGETDWNHAGRMQGHTDIPLNERGRNQASELAERLQDAGIKGIGASDLLRAAETGRIVAQALGVPFLGTHEGFRERSFGVFEGLTRAECESSHGDAWRAWLTDPFAAPPGAEPHEAFSPRLMTALQYAADNWASEGAVLVISHGGSIRTLLAETGGAIPKSLPNGALYLATCAGKHVTMSAL